MRIGIAIVLLRGATDEWLPYPFLDPKNGYAFVAGMTAIVALLLVLVGLALRVADQAGARRVEPAAR